jgi:Uma2 family endonuclease
MNVAVRIPRMTREEFFDWAQAQDIRHEFDGFEPVAMTGGSNRHSLITVNLQAALLIRLRGKPCRSLGPDAGVRTIGDAVRYPDAVVTCSTFDELAHEVPAPVVVFEVISPSSGHTDRIVKLLEYRAVPTIRRYVIVEYASAALTSHARTEAGQDWTTTALTAGDVLHLPDIGIDLPVAEVFAGTDLATADDQPGGDQPG